MVTYEENTTLTGHTNCINSVCFSSDSRVLASGSFDSTIKLWDTETYQEITILNSHTKFVTSVCFQHEQYEYILNSHTKFVTSVCFQHEQYEYSLK